MEETLDAIVCGLGAMGSATAWQLARRGARVLGIDRHPAPHAMGSSHGDTRITRQAIGEGDQYTPLVLRSFEIFREVEALTGKSLLTVTGGLILSSHATQKAFSHVEGFYDNTVQAARRHGIAHELLGAAQIRTRFPAFRVRDNELGYFEPGAGFLRPEACVEAQLQLAQQCGACIQSPEVLQSFSEAAGTVTVHTDRGKYRARQLILACGAWLPRLLEPGQAGWLRVTRQVQFWFALDAPPATFEPGQFPIFIWELQGMPQPVYGFPAIDGPGGGIKIASEQNRVTCDPGSVRREVGEDETRAMYEQYVAPNFNGVGPRCVKAATCLYTMTPDSHFVIDRHPGCKRVIVASACSGHGFKHSAAIGEAIAELATEGRSRIDLAAFSWDRLRN